MPEPLNISANMPPTGASGPQPQDDYAFSYQFDGTFSHLVVDLCHKSKVDWASSSPEYQTAVSYEASDLNANRTRTEVDRAYENLQKSGKGFAMGGRREFSNFHPHRPARYHPRS